MSAMARLYVSSVSAAAVAAAAARADAQLLDAARLHVVDVAGREHEIRLLPRLVEPRVVVDRDLPGARHLEAILRDHDCGRLREADTEQLRVLLDDRDEIVPAVPRVDVLVDRDLAQELERL